MIRRGTDRLSSAGFTLIEVLIAVALFGMAATVLSSSFVNALLLYERGRSQQLLNIDQANVRMQLLLEPSRQAAQDGASCETLHSGLARWYAEIEATDVVDLFRVELHVDFLSPRKGQTEQYSESLYLLRPTWSEPRDRTTLLQKKRDSRLKTQNFSRF